MATLAESKEGRGFPGGRLDVGRSRKPEGPEDIGADEEILLGYLLTVFLYYLRMPGFTWFFIRGLLTM